MWNTLKNAFKSAKEKIKDKIRARFSQLPPPSDWLVRRDLVIGAVMDMADDVVKLEPDDLLKIEWIAAAADSAEFALDVAEYIPGLEKAELVRSAFKSAWASILKFDDISDKFWESKARPFLNRYVERARQIGYYTAKKNA